MRITRTLLIATLAILPLAVFGQEATTNVSVNARGTDIRPVIHDLFEQVKRNYVLAPDVKLTIFLSLHDIEFDEALMLICKNAGLTYELQNGIYFIKVDPKSAVKQDSQSAPKIDPKPNPAPLTDLTKTNPPKTSPSKSETKSNPVLQKSRNPEDPLTVVPSLNGKPAPADTKTTNVSKGTLDKSVLAKRITTRLQKVDLRDLAATLTDQTGILIEIAPDVPAYKLDAYLLRTSLKYALDRVCRGAGLNYIFTDRNSILLQNGSTSKRS
jgi:hypothetical protein